MRFAHGVDVMLRRGVFFLVSLAALVMACKQENGAKAERLCTPEAYVFCRCADRSEGTKRCKEDGASFEECAPCDGSGASAIGGGGTDGLGGGHGTGGDDERSPTSEDPKNGGGSPLEADSGSGSGSSTANDAGQSTPPSSSDGGTKSDAGAKTKDAGAPSSGGSVPNASHCRPLTNTAPRVELQLIADEPSKAVGGKPANGLYVQSWVVEFTGADGEAGPSKHYSRETLEIDGDVGRYVFEDDDGTSVAGGFRLTVDAVDAVDGAKVEVAYECPAAPPKQLRFDATGSTLILYDPPIARVFTKQRTK